VFSSLGWRVITLKYGKRLEAAFAGPDGAALRQWIDDCPNTLYSALTYKGGAAWRQHLEQDLGRLPGIRALLARHDDAALHKLMTNLAGHDMEAVLAAFDEAASSDLPCCVIAYTIKGNGLPFAGHKDNHAGLMSVEQMDGFRRTDRAIFESAELDGASLFKTWWHVALPLARPALMAVGMLSFLFYWNDFINPLLYLRSQMLYTLPVGLLQLQQMDRTNWSILMAASVLVTIPALIVFSVLQRSLLWWDSE